MHRSEEKWTRTNKKKHTQKQLQYGKKKIGRLEKLQDHSNQAQKQNASLR